METDNLFGNPNLKNKRTLKDSFIISPFSVLNSTTQDWLRRRYYWLNKMEYNSDDLIPHGLDPVLVELIVRWFSDVKHKVFSPFITEKVIEFVTVALKRRFTGLHGGDILQNVSPETQDLIVVSPVNATNRMMFKHMYVALKKNRFACVLGDSFKTLAEISALMERHGFILHNELILVRSAGILRTKVGHMMNIDRNVGKIHQYVMVYYKGDVDKIKDEFSEL